MKQPLFFIHRVNTIEHLRRVPALHGVEIDLRANRGRIKLHHEPHEEGEDFEEYLDHFNHAGLILNIKEAGIEEQALKLATARHTSNVFLLDVEFPYMIAAAQKGPREIAVRFSEYESIETVAFFAGKVDWAWIDCVSRLPVEKKHLPILGQFRTCLVCPGRWGRERDIALYKKTCAQMGLALDAVMTEERCVETWLK